MGASTELAGPSTATASSTGKCSSRATAATAADRRHHNVVRSGTAVPSESTGLQLQNFAIAGEVPSASRRCRRPARAHRVAASEDRPSLMIEYRSGGLRWQRARWGDVSRAPGKERDAPRDRSPTQATDVTAHRRRARCAEAAPGPLLGSLRRSMCDSQKSGGHPRTGGCWR